jgi:hypothetical protein
VITRHWYYASHQPASQPVNATYDLQRHRLEPWRDLELWLSRLSRHRPVALIYYPVTMN